LLKITGLKLENPIQDPGISRFLLAKYVHDLSNYARECLVNLELTGWLIAALSALVVGLSKTGLVGIGIVGSIALTLVLPAKVVTGAILPLLILGDIVAVSMFRRHANWVQLWRIFPWAALGVALGWFMLDKLDNHAINRVVGVIVVTIVVLQVIREIRGQLEPPKNPLLAGVVGMVAGISTMIANAAGPIMSVYLLAMKLPKLEFIGTSSWYFLVVNLFKVPFGLNLGIINVQSLVFDLKLVPFVLLGAFLGKPILDRINQLWFERIALIFAFFSGLRLLLF
jgi:uncharacterized protein